MTMASIAVVRVGCRRAKLGWRMPDWRAPQGLLSIGEARVVAGRLRDFAAMIALPLY
jgi:hypothetical protein